MHYAVTLDIDATTRTVIEKLQDRLDAVAGLRTLRQLGSVPHLSLAVYRDLPSGAFAQKLAAFAATLDPLPLSLVGIGLFPGPDGVIFLLPQPSAELIALHRRYHEWFPEADDLCWGYYRPGHWVPHATLAMHATPAAQARGIAALGADWAPLSGRLDHLRLVEAEPVATLARYPFGLASDPV